MSWFDNSKAQISKSHMRNLIAMASADGQFDNREIKFINAMASNLGINSKELLDIINNAKQIKFKPPSTKEESIGQLIELVLMMMVDGKIEDKEMDFCKALAPSLGFKSLDIDNIIATIIDGIQQEVDNDVLFNKIYRMC